MITEQKWPRCKMTLIAGMTALIMLEVTNMKFRVYDKGEIKDIKEFLTALYDAKVETEEEFRAFQEAERKFEQELEQEYKDFDVN